MSSPFADAPPDDEQAGPPAPPEIPPAEASQLSEAAGPPEAAAPGEPAPEAPTAEPPAQTGPGTDGVFVPQTGRWVSGPFRRFYEQYGVGHCGYPISDVAIEDGVPSQYFQRLALEEVEPGRVRLKALGEAWLAAGLDHAGRAPEPSAEVVDLAERLPAHPTKRYATRPLSYIRYLVLHHTGADPSLTCDAIAREHVDVNGWPGMAYHYLITDRGTVFRTQDLTVASYHARQFNPVSAAIALAGDFSTEVPGPAQIEATAALLARLLDDLGLPPSCIRAHREIVPTACPGDTFTAVWRPRLMRLVDVRLRELALKRAEPVAAGDE